MDTFGRFYAAVNIEWPQFGLSDEEAVQQEARWRTTLGGFTPNALAHAMTQALRLAKKRPKAADFREWAAEYDRPRSAPSDAILSDAAGCLCGCGGVRWALVLRDPLTGAVRNYPETVAQMGGPMARRVERVAAIDWERLCGQPMLRVKQECRRRGNAIPADAIYLGDEDGLPVYDAGTAHFRATRAMALSAGSPDTEAR